MTHTELAELATTPEGRRTLDAMAAERVMGWRWVQPPKWDYHGPLPEQGLVLAPPDIDEKTWNWSPKGVIHPHAFLGRFSPTSSIADAWKLVDALWAKRGWRLWAEPSWQGHWSGLCYHKGTFVAQSEWFEDAPLAITIAAILAGGEKEKA